MPFDGIVTKSVVYELGKLLTGTRIDKVQMPEKDEIVLLIRTYEGNTRLSISANPGCPGIYLNRNKKENPQKPGMFCMLLRKHISGGRIKIIDFYDFERVIGIVIEKRNEMGDIEEKKLMVEIMGKYSNIVLINKTGTVIDSIKHIDVSISSKREIMPARPYFMPPGQEKINLDKWLETGIKNLTDSSEPVSRTLLSEIKGFSPMLINEILFRANIDPDTYSDKLTYDHLDRLRAILFDISVLINDNRYSPCIAYDVNDNTKPVDFHCIEVTHQPVIRKKDSILDALGTFYTDKDKYIRLKQKKSDLLKAINTRMKSVQKKISIHTKNLSSNEDYLKYKRYGDLLLANLYSLKEGMNKCTVSDFYDENSRDIEIKLDSNFSPSDNAQKYFKKYTKSKSTYKNAKSQLDTAVAELDYLDSVLLSLELSTEISEISEIHHELVGQDIIKKKNLSVFKEKHVESKPYKYISGDGDIIMVGKNNKQNDYLTMRYASSKDLWLHVKNSPGSHVIVKKTGSEITERTIFEAASLAAYYSKVRNATSVEVDYTEIKHVRKIPGGKPGMVTYYEFKSINVKPEKVL